MNRVLKRALGTGVAVAAASLILVFQGQVYAVEQTVESCPSRDFPKFLMAFSASTEMQRQFTAPAVQFLTLRYAEKKGVQPETSTVKKIVLKFPLISAVGAEAVDRVEVTYADSKHAVVVDKRAGNSDIKVYSFVQESCWVMSAIEDWSINGADLPVSNAITMSKAENICSEKGAAYHALGASEEYPLTKELYEASLENYLCAAESGDPEASYSAATLSMSGMAPSLGKEKTEALYKVAAKTIPQAAARLSLFYCTGGELTGGDPCEDPVNAEKMLIQSITLGNSEALITLGSSFEEGRFGEADPARALACYELAKEKGSSRADVNIEFMKSQKADVLPKKMCY